MWLDAVFLVAPGGHPIDFGPSGYLNKTSVQEERCPCCTCVTHLKLPHNAILENSAVQDLLDWFPGLQKLSVEFHVSDEAVFTLATKNPLAVHHLDLTPSGTLDSQLLAVNLMAFTNLRYLVLNEASCTDDVVRAAMTSCPKLQSLKLLRSREITDAILPLLWGPPTTARLKHLSICMCPSITDAGLTALLEKKPNFQELFLNQLEVSDQSLHLIATSIPRLNHMELEGSLVSERVATLILFHHSLLTYINLEFCRNVTGESIC
ncbi:hypothetical protein HDU67_003788, partial [Dinochytrium kinnereticum]